MDHDLEYAEACHPDPIQILGIRVDAFLVGHQFLLKRIRSPFICDGAYGISELLNALWFCSHSYAEGVKALYRKPFGLRLWTWGKTLQALNQKSIEPHANAFADYIRAAHRGPEKVFIPKGGKTTSTPFTLLLFNDLSEAYGYTWESFMEQPLRKVIIERFGILSKDETVKWRPSFMPDLKEQSHAE